MPKIKKEVEEEIDEVKKVEKKETFVTRWFKENAINNPHDLKIACDVTANSVRDQFAISLATGNTEVFGVVFYATFISILEFIKSKQKVYKRFSIEIANSINIGYEVNESEEMENANITPIMEYVGSNRTIVDTSSILTSEKTSENCIRWMELNIKKNVEYMKEIQEKAFDKLKKEYKVNLRHSQTIIPFFCIFMDTITNMIKNKFSELDGTGTTEVSMNVFNLFDVFYSFDSEANKEIIEFQPCIAMKLALKDDAAANR